MKNKIYNLKDKDELVFNGKQLRDLKSKIKKEQRKEDIEIISNFFEIKDIELQKTLNNMGKQVAKFEKETGCINYLKISLMEIEEELKQKLLGEMK